MPWIHRKVYLAWGRWWAIQVVLWLPEFSLGIHVEPCRPLLDIYLPWVSLSIGNHPVISDERFKHCHFGRGFIDGKWPDDAAL